MGGLRLDCGYAPPAVVDLLHRAPAPFNVSPGALAQPCWAAKGPADHSLLILNYLLRDSYGRHYFVMEVQISALGHLAMKGCGLYWASYQLPSRVPEVLTDWI
jgi:hypothetical protein